MTSQRFILKSNYDGTTFEVDINVINSSVLLKNLFEFTTVTSDNPISIDCFGSTLKVFIELIEIHENAKDDLEKSNLEGELFKHFIDDTTLTKFINDICILDSDILLNALADIILEKLKDMTQIEMNEYLEIENNFTVAEREWQNQNMLQYFISLNEPFSPLQFPLSSCQSFYSLKTKFFSPLNVLLSRICQRADENISFYLSLCSKALKNECDRHPIKVSKVNFANFEWFFCIEKLNFKWSIREKNDKYFDAFSKRKVMAWNDNVDISCKLSPSWETQFNIFKQYLTLEWMIPHKNIKEIKVSFSDCKIFLSFFDVKKFPFSHIYFYLKLYDEITHFEFIYNHFIAKDLSKKVKLHCNLQIFPQYKTTICLYKNPNAAKFFKCFYHDLDKKPPHPKLKTFLMKYLETDADFVFFIPFPNIPDHIINSCPKSYSLKYCLVSDLIKYL